MCTEKHTLFFCRAVGVGVGGKFEPGEDALACALREVREETGLTMHAPIYRGIVDFFCDPWP
uniref:NUDIX domain-containing protein n=1 Tax=Gemmiger formicilis TaxID=745368 RepID=UPI003FEE0163